MVMRYLGGGVGHALLQPLQVQALISTTEVGVSDVPPTGLESESSEGLDGDVDMEDEEAVEPAEGLEDEGEDDIRGRAEIEFEGDEELLEEEVGSGDDYEDDGDDDDEAFELAYRF